MIQEKEVAAWAPSVTTPKIVKSVLKLAGLCQLTFVK